MRRLLKRIRGRWAPAPATRAAAGSDPDCQGVASEHKPTLPQRCKPINVPATSSTDPSPSPQHSKQRDGSSSPAAIAAQSETSPPRVKRSPAVGRNHPPQARLPADVHARDLRDWLIEHGWCGCHDLYGDEIETAYSDFCTEFWIEARPWRAVAPHFNRLLQRPGAALKPTVSYRDPKTGVRRRVRVYRIPAAGEQESGPGEEGRQ